MYSGGGWSDYPSSEPRMGALIAGLNGLTYNPNLNDVGHGSAYTPGSIAADARALNFLGFIPDVLLARIPDTLGGSGTQDLNAGVGAFDPTFKTAVADFQAAVGGLTVDGFIGPATRAALKAAVDAKNAREPSAPAQPSSPGAPAAALTTPASGGTSTGLVVGGVALAAGLAYAVYKYVL